MSNTSSRVQAFLQRAQEINTVPAKLHQNTARHVTSPPRLNKTPVSPIMNPKLIPSIISPIHKPKLSDPSPKTSEFQNPVQIKPPKPQSPVVKPPPLNFIMSPRGATSNRPRYSTPNSVTRQTPPKLRLRSASPASRSASPVHRNLDPEMLNDIEKLVEVLVQSRQKFAADLKAQEEKESEIISKIKSTLQKPKNEESLDPIQQAEL